MRCFEVVRPDSRKNRGIIIRLPERSTKHSACYDFYMPCDITIPPHEKRTVFSDVKACMENDEVLLIFVRSSLGIKKDIVLCNGTGVIDSDYYSNPDNDGNIGIALKNTGHETVEIKKGERVCQGMFVKFMTVDGETEIKAERKGGIGSTAE